MAVPNFKQLQVHVEESHRNVVNHSWRVLNAIRNPTTLSKPSQDKKDSPEEDSTEMLDSETEPCLVMDNVLEEANLPDSHSQNLSSHRIKLWYRRLKFHPRCLRVRSMVTTGRWTIYQKPSLSRKRTARLISGQESIGEVTSIGDFCTAHSLVDQVIDVDSSVTKLLKVLRLI